MKFLRELYESFYASAPQCFRYHELTPNIGAAHYRVKLPYFSGNSGDLFPNGISFSPPECEF